MESCLYDPELYQLTHRGNPGDVSFYRSACKGQRDILELGCGTGRVLIPLAEAGFHMTGIDAHPGMLAALRQKLATHPQLKPEDVTLVEADIRDFSLDARFDRVLMPFNLLFCLLTPEDIITCLKTVRAHLKPNGACIFDLYQADDEALNAIDPDVLDFYASVDDGKREIQIFERRIYEPERHRVDATYRYLLKDHKTHAMHTVEYSIPQIYLHFPQIKKLFMEAGLQFTQLYGDFSGKAFDQESEHIIGWAKAF